MPFGPPPPPPGEFVEFDEEEVKAIKNREGKENTRALRWLFKTGRPYLGGVIVLIVLAALNSLGGVAFALVSQQTVDSATSGDAQGLVFFAILLAVVGCVQIGLRAVDNYATERLNARVINGYRARAFGFVLDRDYAAVSRYHSGDLMNRVTSDVSVVASGVTSFLPSIAEIIANLVGAGAVLLVMDWRFVVVYILATVALIVVNKIFRRRIKALSAKVREKDGKVYSFFQESIANLLVLRVFVTEGRAKRRSDDLLDDVYGASLDKAKVRIQSSSAMGLSMNFGHVFALIWCSFQLLWGNIDYGSLVAILQLSGQVRQPFVSASMLAGQYYTVIASVDRLMEIEQLPADFTSEETALMEGGFDVRKLYESMDALRIEDVTFGYSGRAGEEVLEDVSLDVHRGEFVAIMGQSGCGKSTMFKLMLGVLRPQKGRIVVQGGGAGMDAAGGSAEGSGAVPAEGLGEELSAVDDLAESSSVEPIAGLGKELAGETDGIAGADVAATAGGSVEEDGWEIALGPVTRRLFAYVPQGNMLVSGRLRDNIAFTDFEVTDEQIWEACRIACADEFIAKLPDGLDTVLGERGQGLSEGQVQRIAVARAYLSGAPIMLLDEATSALDDKTEAQLLTNLRALSDRTCLIVTHRKAALSIVDKAVMLQRDSALSIADNAEDAAQLSEGAIDFSAHFQTFDEVPPGPGRPGDPFGRPRPRRSGMTYRPR